MHAAIAQNSAAALFLEGKKNVLGLQQDIPLTASEANAVEDGLKAFESSSHSLPTFRLLRVLLPGIFKADSFRPSQQRKGVNSASGMG